MPEVCARAELRGAASASAVPHHVNAQLLPRVKVGIGTQAVPRDDLRHAALEELRDTGHGVAAADGVDHTPMGARVTGGATAGARDLDPLSRPQRVSRLHAKLSVATKPGATTRLEDFSLRQQSCRALPL